MITAPQFNAKPIDTSIRRPVTPAVRIKLAIMMLLFAGLFFACIPASQYPLSNDQTSFRDERLLGNWFMQGIIEKDRPHAVPKWKELVVRPLAGWKSTLELVDETGAPAGLQGASTKPARIFCTTIHGQNYLTWAEFDSETQQWVYMLGKYTVDGDHGRLVFMKPDATGAEIEAGRLKGTYKPRDESRDEIGADEVMLRSTPQELIDYFSEHPEQCFRGNDGLEIEILRTNPETNSSR